MRPRKHLPLLGLSLTAVLLAGCSGDAAAPVAAPVADNAVEDVVASASAEPSAEASPSASPSTSPSASPSAAVVKKAAAPSYDVAAVQRKLTELKYYVGPADGKQGGALRSAVMAFQKVQGLGADGAVGKTTLTALDAPKLPALKGSSPANRVEVDLTKQVLYVVKGGAVSRIMPVSSGNGATYLQKDGTKAKALTPTGYYKIQRRIVGERKADLGTLYDPQYFYKGWAIHGSNSVPAGPASHGCVRVTRTDAKYLLDAIGNGMTVFLYGGKHTFTAGSSAPGTENPTGDGPTAPAPAASSPSPGPKPSSPAPKPSSPGPKPSSSPSSSPSPSASSSPKPSPSVSTPAQ